MPVETASQAPFKVRVGEENIKRPKYRIARIDGLETSINIFT